MYHASMARIDDSHQPFKRKVTLGPGPRKRPKVMQAKDWECVKVKPTKTHYRQVCKWVGDGDRAPKTVRIKKKWKKAYNKVYRTWAKNKRLAARGPVKTYRCRRRPGTSCR